MTGHNINQTENKSELSQENLVYISRNKFRQNRFHNFGSVNCGLSFMPHWVFVQKHRAAKKTFWHCWFPIMTTKLP